MTVAEAPATNHYTVHCILIAAWQGREEERDGGKGGRDEGKGGREGGEGGRGGREGREGGEGGWREKWGEKGELKFLHGLVLMEQ